MDKEDNKHLIELYFRTSNFCLAATLSLYANLETIQWRDQNVADFVFINSHALGSYIEMFFNKELQVEPQTYFNKIKELKSRLHERI